jgi:hypothetical protein
VLPSAGVREEGLVLMVGAAWERADIRLRRAARTGAEVVFISVASYIRGNKRRYSKRLPMEVRFTGCAIRSMGASYRKAE